MYCVSYSKTSIEHAKESILAFVIRSTISLISANVSQALSSLFSEVRSCRDRVCFEGSSSVVLPFERKALVTRRSDYTYSVVPFDNPLITIRGIPDTERSVCVIIRYDCAITFQMVSEIRRAGRWFLSAKGKAEE